MSPRPPRPASRIGPTADAPDTFHGPSMPRLPLLTLFVGASLLAGPASALDLSWSGFGTLGWAQSDRAWRYERSIDDDGGFDRDSVLGLQVDATLSPAWSATVQLKAAPALDRDGAWDLTPAWAFVAWRPGDDWLLRAGRLRLPLYLYSEAMDVGATHDFARLPTEMYSITPTSDFDGGYATRTWDRGDDELALDVYAGRRDTTARWWSRDGMPGERPAGANFVDIRARAVGVALTLRRPDGVWRAGLHRFSTGQTDGGRIPVTLPYVEIAPGLGFYQVGGPGVRTLGTITNYVATLGVEQRFAGGWRVAAEYARNLQRDTEFASNTAGGYAALLREVGTLTPYVAVGRLRSTQGTRDWYRRLTAHPLPGQIPGADRLNAAQRLTAESIWAADQRSVALGASWTPAPNRKLKLEWKRTTIGQMSRLVDTPAGSDTIHDTHVDVWSLNYGFAF